MSEGWPYVVSGPARRDLRGLDRVVRERILVALARFGASGVGDVRKLAGREGEWRLRVGDYRVLFERDVQRHVLVILSVRHRSEAYRE